MAEIKAGRLEEVDIFDIFDETKRSLQNDVLKNTGKIEMLDEITVFFKEKKLQVVHMVEEPKELPESAKKS